MFQHILVDMRPLLVVVACACLGVAAEGPSAPRLSEQGGDLPRQIADDTGALARVAATAVAAAAPVTPIVGTHVDDALMAQWVAAIGGIPRMWLDAGTAHLRAADRELHALGFPAASATVLLDQLDRLGGAAVQQLRDPAALFQAAVLPGDPPSR